MVQRAIPPFSNFSSVKQLWERYDSSDPLTGRMAWKKLEELHRSDWRPIQRRDWSIVMVFVREVLQMQVAAAGQRLTDGQVVDQMDQEREQQGVKVPGYLKALSSRQQGEGGQGDDGDAARITPYAPCFHFLPFIWPLHWLSGARAREPLP